MSARTREPAVLAFLIADVRGYTRFTAEQGDEAASRLATTFAQIVSEAIAAWGGAVIEVRGDEVLAVFESPRSAVRAAADLQNGLAAETAVRPDLPLHAGIGLDVGEAVAVGDGYRGAALNLAARLSSLAEAGEVIASSQITHIVGHVEGVRYAPLQPVPLKGIAEPVAPVRVEAMPGAPTTSAYPVARATAPLPPELDPIVPLAGRQQELRWVSWHWRRARHGQGRIVVVAGQPGIGKTRLAAELATLAHTDGGAVTYLPSGRADASRLAEAATADGPALVVIDDLDAAPRAFADGLAQLNGSLVTRPILVLVTHREAARPALTRLVERLAGSERRLPLGPLEPDAVRAIAALYAGRSVEELPLDRIVAESGGVPAAVHRIASIWAGSRAVSRLTESASATRTGRQGLRDAEARLVGDVSDLERVRERARLYSAGADAEDEVGLAVCPYKGLASFEAADADYYFGRERLVAELVARLVGTSFLALVGASGSGKSSVVAAGLLPSLAGGVLPGSDGWPQVTMRPGDHPLLELQLALEREGRSNGPRRDVAVALQERLADLGPGQRLILVVDQFEELFNATRDETERAAFIELLTSERTGLKVIVLLRADHYGHCAGYPALARAVGGNHVLVGPLSRKELTAIIEHPAQRVGLRVEPELVEALIVETGDEPGALPLLSTSLLELWQAREGRRLTLAAYRATGGVRGAVARLAEAAYGELKPEQRLIARSVLLRLAGPGEGEGVVRRRVPLAELDVERDAETAAVVEGLTVARLLTVGDGYVEVAHEALLREWPRLRQWLDEDATGNQVRLHLGDSARDWARRGREDSDLYRGARLAAALDWAAGHDRELNAAERDFLAASRLAAEQDAERQRRTNRRLRLLLAGAGVFLVLALAAGAVAFLQGQRATEQAGLARARQLAAAAISVRDDDPALSKLLALSAAGIEDPPPTEVVSALHEAWAADKVVGLYRWPDSRETGGLWTESSPDGTLVAATGTIFLGPPSTYLEIVELSTGAVRWSYEVASPAMVGQAWFTPDGSFVVAGSWWNPNGASEVPGSTPAGLGIHVWDVESGSLVATWDVGPCGGFPTAIAETRVLVRSLPAAAAPACGWSDLEWAVEVLQLDTGERRMLATAGFSTDDGALSRDGRYAAFDEVFREEERVVSVVVDVQTGDRVLELDPASFTNPVWVRKLSPDGSLLLYGDAPIYVYDVPSGEQVGSFDLHGGTSLYASFDHAGNAVASSGRDGTLHLWRARAVDEVIASARPVGAGNVSTNADGSVLVADPVRRQAFMVQPETRGEVWAFEGCSEFIVADTLQVAGSLLTFSEVCAGAYAPRVVDPTTAKLVHDHTEMTGQAVELSPNGELVAYQTHRSIDPNRMLAGPIIVTDARTGEQIVQLEGLCEWNQQTPVRREQQPGCFHYPVEPFGIWVKRMRWSPDGTKLAAVDAGALPGYVAVWDVSTGRRIGIDVVPSETPFDVIFTPDSARLVVSYGDGAYLRAFSTDTWDLVTEASVENGSVVGLIGFTEDGSQLVALEELFGTGGGALHWFDADSLALVRSVPRIHEGAPKAMSMSPDLTLIATGSADGYVKVWETLTGNLVHEIRIPGDEVNGVAFVNDRHVAVAPTGGPVLLMTIDTGELIRLVRSSLLRGFTGTECDRYGFGDDCPSLDELRDGR